MFSALNFPSPRLSVSQDELFSPNSDCSRVSDTGLPTGGRAEAAYNAGVYDYEGAVRSEYPRHQDDQFENHDMIQNYNPPPSSQPYNPIDGYDAKTGLHGINAFSTSTVQPARLPQADTGHMPRLSDFPELYSQFLPSIPTRPTFTYPSLSTSASLPTLHQDLAFPPPISHVYTASNALRNAISHPALTTASASPSNRSHPYHARSRNPSTGYDRRISQMSSTAALNINARPLQRLSNHSTPSLTISASQYSGFGETQNEPEGEVDQEIQTPLTAGFDHATSRYYDASLAHQPSYPQPTASIHPGHLFMSGLATIPSQLQGLSGEELLARDAAVWGNLKGRGLDAQEEEEEEEDELDEDSDDENMEVVDQKEEVDEGEESETDTPLALIRDRRIVNTTPSSPTPTVTAAVALFPTLPSNPKPQRRQVPPCSSRLEVEVEDTDATPRPGRYPSPDLLPEDGCPEVETSGALGPPKHSTTVTPVDSEAFHKVHPLPPRSQKQIGIVSSRSRSRKEPDSTSDAPASTSLPTLNEQVLGSIIVTAEEVPTTAVESLIQLGVDQAKIEVEYHPSGRMKRSAASRPINLPSQPSMIIPSTSTVLSGNYDGGDELSKSSQSTDGSDEDEDDYETLTADGDEEEYGARGARAHSSKPSSSALRRFGKVKVERNLTDSEMVARVESLRDRLMDNIRRTGNFDEKLCQVLTDDRFFPKYIRWSEDGESIFIPRFGAFRSKAGPFVMCASIRATAFNKQFNNRTTSGTGDNAAMLLTHPRLNRDDEELWDAVGQLPKLVEHVQGSNSSSSSNNNKPKSQTSNKVALLRDKQAHQLEIANLISQIDALKLEKVNKDRYYGALVGIRKDHPDIWTEKNVKKWGLNAEDIPTPPTKTKTKSKSKTQNIDSVVITSGTTSVVTKKRSRHGVVGTKSQQGDEETLEVSVEAEEHGHQSQTISRKKSKLVLTKGRK